MHKLSSENKTIERNGKRKFLINTVTCKQDIYDFYFFFAYLTIIVIIIYPMCL